jgi:hypothetical protein
MADTTKEVVTEQEKSAHGWKTYLAAAIALLNAVSAAAVDHDWKTALGSLTVAVGLIGIRGAFAKLIAAARGISG